MGGPMNWLGLPSRKEQTKPPAASGQRPGLNTVLGGPTTGDQAVGDQAVGDQAKMLRGPGRRRAKSAAQGDNENEAIGGIEGIDYEVVSTRRSPGSLGAILVLVAVALLGLWGVSRVFFAFRDRIDPPGEASGEVVVALPAGSSTAGISELLEANDVIADATAYEWYVRLRGGPAFQAGDYVFQQNSAVWEALDVLRAGPVRAHQALTVSVTFPEGLTVAEMAQRVDETPNLSFDGDAFVAALADNPPASGIAVAPVPPHRETIEPAEGLLFGETYFLSPTSTANQLIELMVDQLDAVLASLGYGARPHPSGLTAYELLIAASIIEREALLDEDRAKVARVIYNRLEADWTLGMDVTVAYLVGGGPLTVEDLEIDSPYNTRRFRGLPPTPIASPSALSLEAALNPAEGDWMFFVQTAADGTLSFSETVEQFNRDVEVCRVIGLCD